MTLMKDLQATLRNTKVSMNKDTGVFSYEATGSIDQGAKTMTFDEGLSIANSFFFSFGEIAFHQTHITTN